MPSADPRPNGPQPKVNGGTAGPGSEDASSNPALADATSDLTNAVDEMLKQLQDKFGRVSEEMVTRMAPLTMLVDDMSRRLDGLEAQMRSSNDSGGRTSRASAGGVSGK